eukprot:10861538-Karenia_brevis.AAC.1
MHDKRRSHRYSISYNPLSLVSPSREIDVLKELSQGWVVALIGTKKPQKIAPIEQYQVGDYQ